MISFGGRTVVGFGLGANPIDPMPGTQWMGNPAAENCVAKGGKLTTYTNPNGDQGGLCTLPDGSVCEEWALFNGKCAPGDSKKLSTRAANLILPGAVGAAIGGLIGYGVKRNAHGAGVGALVGGVAPYALVAAIIVGGWRP